MLKLFQRNVVSLFSVLIMQITGMGTALKILFSGDSMLPDSTVTQLHKKAKIPFQLTRGEIVALFNAFGRSVYLSVDAGILI
jgi:hypothetical protein